MAPARHLALALTALTACYAPGSETSCTVQCASGGDCPGDFECRANGLCGAAGDMCINGPPSDAMNDGSTGDVGGDGRICYGHGVAPFLSVCPPQPIAGSRNFSGVRIDTASDCTFMVIQQNPSAPPVCAIVAQAISIDGTVPVRGPYPLLLLGIDSLSVNAGSVVDVASHVGTVEVPAGAPGPLCAAGNGQTDSAISGAGGGAGGTLGGGGASGSTGGTNGAGGAAQLPAAVTFLRGGCPGGNGGNVNTSDGARGGGAGGALYLMSNVSITVGGSINASGSGAARADTRAGGGGGGSGGMIVLDAPTQLLTGRLYALGGGGSSGGSADMVGNLGSDPRGIMQYAVESVPPNGGTAGKGGGGGAPLVGMAGDAGGQGNGGGGGGGGGGVIRSWPPPTALVVAADPQPF